MLTKHRFDQVEWRTYWPSWFPRLAPVDQLPVSVLLVLLSYIFTETGWPSEECLTDKMFVPLDL